MIMINKVLKNFQLVDIKLEETPQDCKKQLQDTPPPTNLRISLNPQTTAQVGIQPENAGWWGSRL